jgi:hypothetical protein
LGRPAVFLPAWWGFGEVCPLGPAYLPAHGGGALAALRELAPAVVGVDATNLGAVRAVLDRALMGHEYAKSAVDVACWDVLGRTAGLPVCELLGGRVAEELPLYFAVPLGSREAMAEYVAARRAQGVHRFQLKLGADPLEDAARTAHVVEQTEDGDLVVADANGGWRLQDAVLAARALDGLPRVFFEQPCPTLEECLIVRERTTLPMVLDESIRDVQSLVRAYEAKAMEAINLKVSKVGGLTPARLMRDLAQTLGLRLTHRPRGALHGLVDERLDDRDGRRPPPARTTASAARPTAPASASRWTSSALARPCSPTRAALDARTGALPNWVASLSPACTAAISSHQLCCDRSRAHCWQAGGGRAMLAAWPSSHAAP